MLFVITCVDKPNRTDVRLANRAAHLDFLKSLGEKCVMAGPTLSEDGQSMTGSVLLFEQPDRATLEALLETEPYYKAGLFEAVIIRPYKKVIG